MIKQAIPVLIAATALVGFGGPAHATTNVVRIYMANTDRSPQSVSANCDGWQHPFLHTTLFNDQVGNYPVERVKIVREDTNAIVFGPVDVSLNVPYAVNMPYLPGVAFNAIAVPQGFAFPTNLAEYSALAAAHEVDNSQLFAPGTGHDKFAYPALPVNCLPPKPTPTPTPSTTTSHNCDNGSPDEVCPTTTSSSPKPSGSSSSPSGTPTPTKTVPSPCSSEVMAVLVLPGCPTPTSTPKPTPTLATTPTKPVPVPSASTTSTGPALAHTGASVVPFVIGAGVLGAAGVGLVYYARKRQAGIR